MKKFIYGIIMIMVLSLWACDNRINKNDEDNITEILEETMGGKKLFSDKLDEIIEIIFYFFDERTIEIDNKEKIQEVLELLQSLDYQKLAPYKEPEEMIIGGFYDFDLITENEIYYLGIGEDMIVFEGDRYKVNIEDDLETCIFKILEIELN